MEIWQAIVLGAVQGFTEFLPVSSSGHLLLLQHWFGIEEGSVFFTVMMHLATLIPVVIVLWGEIVKIFKKPFPSLWYLVVATIPAGIVGIFMSVVYDLDKLFNENIWLLGITFLITAGEMLFSEIYAKRHEQKGEINFKSSFIMGCGQAVGVVQGISRSGSVITAGTLAKVERNQCANFTFLMSIPIILAAVAMELLKGFTGEGFGQIGITSLAFGVVTAIVCGYIAAKFMLRLIKKANFKWFAVYLLFASASAFITAFV